ncbi:DUF2231 domain-containing protein [Desulfobulbus propionicus]|jgi:uncharacterized membrane protein
MIEALYAILGKVGFHHPLHPALTHLPMGMVMGCFLFDLLTFFRKKTGFLTTSLHCRVLALISMAPTVIAGTLDWQHLYGGRFLPLLVVKMVLAVALTALLIYAVLLQRQNAEVKKILVVSGLCLACAIGLGFSGGELVYGG